MRTSGGTQQGAAAVAGAVVADTLDELLLIEREGRWTEDSEARLRSKNGIDGSPDCSEFKTCCGKLKRKRKCIGKTLSLHWKASKSVKGISTVLACVSLCM